MNTPLTSHPVYRAYVIGPDGGILISHTLICETDEDAISKAKKHARGNAVELWDRGRKVAFIPLGCSSCIVF